MYIIRKIPKQNKYKVYNKETKETHSFHNNRLDAIQQVEILHESLNEGVFSKVNNFAHKVVDTVSDLAGKANVFLQGSEISDDKPENNGLYGDEIENILNKHGYHINGVFSKDKLPKTLKDGWYVINLQSTNEGNRKGTHWTCFKSTDNAQIIEYFDAFGFAPPVEIMEKANGDILYSDKQIQDINATTCGWFCIAAIVSNKSTESPQSHFKKFISMFSDNTNINDGILAKYLHRKDIQ